MPVMASNDSLAARMKEYEQAARSTLTNRLPVIIRVDGKAFSSYTRGCERPFDVSFGDVMLDVAHELINSVQNAQVAYVQSDEVSVLLHSYKRLNSQPWFKNQVQKMCSVAASIASATFTANSWKIWAPKSPATNPDLARALAVHGAFVDNVRPAVFDARVFTVPERDVCNYFLWRQKDAMRNSVQMLARSLYSHKECQGKNRNALREMCLQKGKSWDDVDARWQRGACVYRSAEKTIVDTNIPVFSSDRGYIERHLSVTEG